MAEYALELSLPLLADFHCSSMTTWMTPTGLNNVCACVSCHGAIDCVRPKYHNNPYENGGVFENSRVDPDVL